MKHCATVGAHLLGRLHKLAAKHDIIGDIRGQGLMLGVELVKDRTTKVCVCTMPLWVRCAKMPSQIHVQRTPALRPCNPCLTSQ